MRSVQLALACLIVGVSNANAQACKSLEELVEHSKTSFVGLRGEVAKREFTTTYKTSYRLPAADNCTVTETGSGISFAYGCQWMFGGASLERGRAKYNELRSWVTSCLPQATENDYVSSTSDASVGKRFKINSVSSTIYLTHRASVTGGMVVSLRVLK